MNKVIFEINDGTTKEFDGEKFTDEHIGIFNRGNCNKLLCGNCPFNGLPPNCIGRKGFSLPDIIRCYRVTEEPKPIQILKRLIDGGSVWVDGVERNIKHLSIDGAVCSHGLDYRSVTLEKPKKQIKVERWINVYSGGNIGTYKSKELADMDAGENRIACEHFVREYEV